jgi:hypothetical protein
VGVGGSGGGVGGGGGGGSGSGCETCEDIAQTLVTTFWCFCSLSFPYAGPYLQRNKVTKRL